MRNGEMILHLYPADREAIIEELVNEEVEEIYQQLAREGYSRKDANKYYQTQYGMSIREDVESYLHPQSRNNGL